VRRVLNVKRLLIVLGVAVLFALTAFGVHHVQFGRQASALYDQARRVEKDDPEKAIELLERYVKYRPKDEEAVIWYLDLVFDQARADPRKAQRAVDAGEKALRTFRDHPAHRRRLVEAYVLLGQYRDPTILMNNARDHLRMLFADSTVKPDDVELLELAATVELLGGDPARAVEYLQKAIDTGKAPAAVYGRLLEVYWVHQKTLRDPEGRTNSLILALKTEARFQQDLDAKAIVITFRTRWKDRIDAEAQVRLALALPGGKSHPGVLLAAVELELTGMNRENKDERLRRAEGYARDATRVDPKNVRAALVLADVLFARGNTPEAIQELARLAGTIEKVNDGYLLVLDRLIDLGDDKTVPGMIRRVRDELQSPPLVGYFLGRLVLMAADRVPPDDEARWQAALAGLRTAGLPDDKLPTREGAWQTARLLLEKAAPALERVPELYKKALVGIARCYEATQNPDGQLAACDAALEKDPNFLPALVGRAEALVMLGRYDKAQPALRVLVEECRLDSFRGKLARVELLAVRTQAGPRNWDAFDRALGLETVPLPPDSPAEWVTMAAKLPPQLRLLFAESLVLRGREEEARKTDEGKKRAADFRKAAVAILEQLTEREPGFVPAWVALGHLRHPADPDGVLATLDAGVKKAEEAARRTGKPVRPGVVVEFRLARVATLTSRPVKPGPAELRKEIAETEPLIDAWVPPADAKEPEKLRPVGERRAARHRLWSGMGGIALQVADGRRDPAAVGAMRGFTLECYQAAAALDPKDLPSRVTLIDLGMMTGRRDVVEAALKQIGELEGPDGPITALGQVVVRLPEVAALPDPEARRAEVLKLRVLAEKARTSRSGWSRAYVVLGQLDELAGEYNAAADHYREAISLGDRQEFVVRRITEIYLYKLDPPREDDALTVLNLVAADVPLPPNLEQFRVVRKLIASDHADAREARIEIDRIAPESSDSDRIQLLRGSLLAAVGENADAERAFRRALERNDQVPETWTTLVVQLVRMGKIAQAEEVLAQAEKALTRPPKDPVERARLLIGLAECYELLGKMNEADQKYRQALAVAPEELAPNRELVHFLQRTGRTDEADKMLQGLGGRRPELARWARRHRALTLMAGPDAYRDLPAALELVRQNLREAQNAKPDDDDLKAEAVLKTVNPQTRAEGEKVLEGYARFDKLTPDENYLLAQLRFNRGDVTDSVEYFDKAARPRPGRTLEHLAARVRVYLALSKLALTGGLTGLNGTPSVEGAKNYLALAEGAIRQLEMTAPQSWEAARERARLLHQTAVVLRAQDPANAAEAAALDERARKLIRDDPHARTEPYVRFRSGPLLDELGFDQDAEDLYRELLKTARGDGPHLPLATFLIAHKRSTEAIELAWKYEGKCHVGLTARILTGSVRARRPEAAVETRIDQWLDQKLQSEEAKTPDVASTLWGCKAELLEAQGKYDPAIAAYEKAIALNPDRSDVLVNNQCVILVLTHPEQADRAIETMERLIKLRGPVPVFLDTQALAYLVRGGRLPDGQYAAALAVRKLELALAQRESPVYLFHLAWAYDQMGSDKSPQRNLKLARARELGLTADDLHPLEARQYRQYYPGK
jgi:tetratricopeptide (TPR) repeat protein